MGTEERGPDPMPQGWGYYVSEPPFCAVAESAWLGYMSTVERGRVRCGGDGRTFRTRSPWRMVIFAARKMARGTCPINRKTIVG